jgi:hypothetical protein
MSFDDGADPRHQPQPLPLAATRPGKVLWVVSGLAASILGVWGIAWSTGVWGSGTDSDSTGGESTELVRHQAASDPQVTAEKRGDAVAAVPGAREEPSRKQDTPRRVAQSSDKTQPHKTQPHKSSGRTARAVPDAGVKLKKLAPPDINGTVRVVLKGENRTDYMFEPIKMIGTFRVEPTIEDGFCVDVFQLEVERVEVIE